MKHQALFSSKDKSKKTKALSLSSALSQMPLHMSIT